MAKPAPVPVEVGQAGTLIRWAQRIFKKEKTVSARVAILRSGRVAEIAARPLVGDVGVDGLVQAAAILARTAADDELVAVLARANTEGRRFGVDSRTGLNPGFSAILVGRSRNGETVGKLFRGEWQAGRAFTTSSYELTADQVAGIEDWTDSLVLVDPELDRRLAAKRFPGAEVPVPEPVDPLSMLSPSSNGAPVAAGASAHHAARADEPADPGLLTAIRVLSFPWEAARSQSKDLLDLTPNGLGAEPFAWTAGGGPANLNTRRLTELLKSGWRNDMQAVQVASQVRRAANLRSELRAVLEASLPDVAKAFGCAFAAFVALQRGEREIATEAGNGLVSRVDAAIAASGGETAWLSEAWPDKPGAGTELGTVWIACATTAAFWRLAMAMRRPVMIPPPDESEVAGALRAAKDLRDRILDRVGASGSTPAMRLVDLGKIVLGSVPSELGEPRLKRWFETAMSRGGRQTPELTIRDFAAINAVVLHTLVVITELVLARSHEVDFEGQDVWRPEDTPLEGLLQYGRTLVARHQLHRAALATSEEATLAALDRAAAVSDGDETIAACFNEARYRAGRLDDRLLADVTKEAGRNQLASTAEMLRVAERIGRRREAKVARKWLEKAARKSPHSWIADVRIAFGRPQELADAQRIRQLELGSAPTNLDARERSVFALYGAEPSTTITSFRRALAAQREAIDWARQLAEERTEEALTAPAAQRERPEVPLEPTLGAATLALAALRYRLDRPKLARHPLKSRLEAHARRSAELAAADEAAAAITWLEALGTREGLVAQLDAAIREADAPKGEQPATTSAVEAALARADSALEAALSASWCGSFQTRLRSVWPLLAQTHDERGTDLAREAADLQRRGELASDASVREAAERDLGALFERAQDAVRAAIVEMPDGATTAAPAVAAADDFRPMLISDRAIERSRRDLDTPEWAITEGIRQVALFNLTGGKRDRKMLRGTRVEAGGALWELRRHDGRGPLRVMYVLAPAGPRVVAILAKQDEAHQRRMIERTMGWDEAR